VFGAWGLGFGVLWDLVQNAAPSVAKSGGMTIQLSLMLEKQKSLFAV
jgi:hypothetical protein